MPWRAVWRQPTPAHDAAHRRTFGGHTLRRNQLAMVFTHAIYRQTAPVPPHLRPTTWPAAQTRPLMDSRPRLAFGDAPATPWRCLGEPCASAHASARRRTSPDFWQTHVEAEPIGIGCQPGIYRQTAPVQNVDAQRLGRPRRPARSWTHVHGSPSARPLAHGLTSTARLRRCILNRSRCGPRMFAASSNRLIRRDQSLWLR